MMESFRQRFLDVCFGRAVRYAGEEQLRHQLKEIEVVREREGGGGGGGEVGRRGERPMGCPRRLVLAPRGRVQDVVPL